MFNDVYKGKRVLVTGHAGFKGSWLCLWLERLGATVIGYGHVPSTEPSHYRLLGAQGAGGFDLLKKDWLIDAMRIDHPDLVIHLAAKACVAKTFDDPQGTFENNVMGAVNILEAVRHCPSVKGTVMVVTDKIYQDKGWDWGYRECDKLGGWDPYSASKICCEYVIECYRKSFGLNIATARAGNVIGGGDWTYARLIPDIVRAAAKGEKVKVHTPNATRPWQHVLEALSGYLTLGQHILEGKDVNDSFNFGPDGDAMTVLEVLQVAKEVWPKVDWEVDNLPTHPGMIYLLKIDSTKAKKMLGWRPVWDMKKAVERSILWYKMYYQYTGHILSNHDIRDYEEEII